MTRRLLVGVFLMVTGMLVLFHSAHAQGLEGLSYYTFAFDVTENTIENFTFSFSDNETDQAADNATADNQTATGGVSILVQNKSFVTPTGSYIATGNFFNGTWQATEKEYSSYYQENMYTYYSLIFFGGAFINKFFLAGVMYSTITTQSVALGTDKKSTVAPFMGILVNTGD